MIKQDKQGKWWLHFSSGRKEGPFPSQAKVMARERQVNYFKHRNKYESALHEGIWDRIARKAVPAFKNEAEKAAKELADKYKADIRKMMVKGAVGVGGIGLVSSGVGSYAGARLANKKKKLKESAAMLLPFVVGIGNKANILVQEAAKEVLGLKRLGQAMYNNPNTMRQVFKLYPQNTIKKLVPDAFGIVNKAKKGT